MFGVTIIIEEAVKDIIRQSISYVAAHVLGLDRLWWIYLSNVSTGFLSFY